MKKRKIETLTEFLNEHLEKDRNVDKVTVFPLRCGVGKSTYIRHRIFQALNNNEKLIVITDSISRLNDYTKDDELSDYINRNKGKLSILTADNISTESYHLHKRNIVCMTTQRYFRLTVEEIKKLTADRHLILFDEKPYLYELKSITIKTLNDVDSALNMGLDNMANQDDKEWIVQEWKKLKERIQKVISEYEKQNEGYQFKKWYIFEDGAISADDKRFFEIVDRYKMKLNKFKSDTYQNILAVKQLIADGGLFVSTKISKNSQKSKYNNSFEVVIDNQNKLTNIGAKVFVFDGTADIDPDYRLPYVEMVDCNRYLLQLNNLTIDCVNVTTSKNKLLKRNNDGYLSAITDYIKSLPQNVDVVFSYKDLEPIFEKNFANVNYFGNIKGLNNYRQVTDIVQIGLNRYPDNAYILGAGFNSLSKYKDCKGAMIKVIGQNAINETMNLAILADIEQNLFRTKIRNIGCKDDVHYTILFNTVEFHGLIELIKERYGKLGAVINIIDTPMEIRLLKYRVRNTQKTSNAQKIIEWVSEQPKGRTFKMSEMLQETQLSYEQFKSIKKKNQGIRELLGRCKTIKKGYYVIA